MEMFFGLFIVSLTSILSVSGTKNQTCDYAFGDPTWNYSKVFYNQDVRFPAGAKEHTIVLPDQKGLMISYICIHISGNSVNKDTTTAAFYPLDREVSLVLANPTPQVFPYHVYAKRHGY